MVNLNGKIYDSKSPILLAGNRAFLYGDALFETMRMMAGEIHLLDLHLERLKKGMRYLGFEGEISYSFIKKEIKKITGKVENARIRLEVFRTEGGLYTPKKNSYNFLISYTLLEEKHFALNEKGLKIGFYQEEYLSCTTLSNLKTTNALPYILAARFRQKNGWDDCLLFNDKNNIAEASSSNVFLVKNEKVFTPSKNQGCVLGVMRKRILRILQENKIPHQEKALSQNDFIEADEIFLTNAIQGIRWVEKLCNENSITSYNHEIAKKLSIT